MITSSTHTRRPIGIGYKTESSSINLDVVSARYQGSFDIGELTFLICWFHTSSLEYSQGVYDGSKCSRFGEQKVATKSYLSVSYFRFTAASWRFEVVVSVAPTLASIAEATFFMSSTSNPLYSRRLFGCRGNNQNLWVQYECIMNTRENGTYNFRC